MGTRVLIFYKNLAGSDDTILGVSILLDAAQSCKLSSTLMKEMKLIVDEAEEYYSVLHERYLKNVALEKDLGSEEEGIELMIVWTMSSPRIVGKNA